MERRDFAISFGSVLFATMIPLQAWTADEKPSYSGTWQAGDKSSELVVEQSADSVHLTEQRGGKILCDYTCNANGKDCDFKEEGKKAKVSVYFNGPKLVEIRTRGDVVMKRRFGLKDDGKTLEVEIMPLVPAGKNETVLYAKR